MGEISAANDRLCLSGTKGLTDFNQGHIVFCNDEKTDMVSSNDMPRESKELANLGGHRVSCLLGLYPREMFSHGSLGFTSHELPLSEQKSHLGIFRKPLNLSLGPDILCVGRSSPGIPGWAWPSGSPRQSPWGWGPPHAGWPWPLTHHKADEISPRHCYWLWVLIC